MSARIWRNGIAVGLVVGVLAQALPAAKDIFDVDGAGWWEDRLIDRALRNLRGDHVGQPADANAVEDAVFFSLSTVAAKGFLDAVVTAEIERVNGEVFTHEFDADFTNLLPRPLAAQRVRLQIERGMRTRFREVDVEGVAPELTPKQARELVVPPSGLIPSGEAKAFTPDRLQAGLGRIELVLRERGYTAAVARVVEQHRDEAAGLVDVVIEVDMGARWWVRSVDVRYPNELDITWPDISSGPDQWWNPGWAQDQIEAVRQVLLPRGYPDARVRLEKTVAEITDGLRPVDVVLVVESGEYVTMGPVRFEGDDQINTRTLHRRIEVSPGEPLDRLALEQARRRIGRLSAFRRVTFDYEPSTGAERSPVFTLEPRMPWETSVLAGWGSYEQLRAGFEVVGHNLWRRSHRLRLEAMASLRSQRGELIYTVPDFAGELIDGSVRFFGLDREEFAFQRQEYGTTASLSRRNLPWVQADGSVSYTFQNLVGRDNELASRSTDDIESRSASVTFTLNRDHRDNQLNPTSGYRWFGQIELADEALGGQVGYQRLELGASWHHPFSETNGVHVGISHGTIWTLGRDNDLSLPVNKRFFPGGEHSLRGVQSGEGSPIDGSGEYVGAKSFTLLNLEFEQALTSRFSAVVFVDALAATARLSDTPWDNTLYTLGGGLRYDTIIGPIRLEYGHNLNPRPVDPVGTWHFSIGFPF